MAGKKNCKDLIILSRVLILQGINLLTDGNKICSIDATGGFFAYERIWEKCCP